jgi:hypothetical protein
LKFGIVLAEVIVEQEDRIVGTARLILDDVFEPTIQLVGVGVPLRPTPGKICIKNWDHKLGRFMGRPRNQNHSGPYNSGQ